MTTLQSILLGIGFLAAVVLLLRKAKNTSQQYLVRQQNLFKDVLPLLKDHQSFAGDTAGVWKVTGTYAETPFQFTTIMDSLATRKLPSLWLQVTLPRPQPVPATLDLMMRPNGPSTFSNFDFLADTISTPPGLPEHCVLRSDDAAAAYPLASHLLPHMTLFRTPMGKEFLISPKGLRIVLQLAESDRLRYGVFRQVDFGDVCIDPSLARQTMDTLLALENNLGEHAKHD